MISSEPTLTTTMILACHHHVILLVVLVLVGYFLAALTYCRGGQSMLRGPVSVEYRITWYNREARLHDGIMTGIHTYDIYLHFSMARNSGVCT